MAQDYNDIEYKKPIECELEVSIIEIEYKCNQGVQQVTILQLERILINSCLSYKYLELNISENFTLNHALKGRKNYVERKLQHSRFAFCFSNLTHSYSLTDLNAMSNFR